MKSKLALILIDLGVNFREISVWVLFVYRFKAVHTKIVKIRDLNSCVAILSDRPALKLKNV